MYKDITRDKQVPRNGFCFNIQSEALPTIVLPSNSTDEDCFCSTLLQDNCYNYLTCSCINETVFAGSLYTCKWEQEHPVVYHFCIFNLTSEMDNKQIHFFKGLRQCMDRRRQKHSVYFRQYFHSFTIRIGNLNYSIFILKL